MGFKSSEWAYSVPGLTAPERAVLIALAHCRNDKSGACFPGQDTLVQMTALSEKTVRRALSALESRDAPVIARTARFAGRYRTSDSYDLLFDNYRSERPPVTVTTGQDDHRSESPSPPVTVTLTTGHRDHPIEEEQEAEHEEEQKERALSPFCSMHPDGTEAPCGPCGTARVRYERSVAIKPRGLSDADWNAFLDDPDGRGATRGRLTPTERAMQTAAAGRRVAGRLLTSLDPMSCDHRWMSDGTCLHCTTRQPLVLEETA